MHAGAAYVAVGLMPSLSAAASTSGLKAEPVCWRLCVARLTFAAAPGPKKSRPPTMARTKPVPGSSDTSATSGSCSGSGRISVAAASAARWASRSTVVWILRPPPNSRSRRAWAVDPKRGSSRIHCFTASTKYAASYRSAAGTAADAERDRLALGRRGLRLGRVVVVDHPVEHHVAPRGGGIEVVVGIGGRRALDEPGQQRAFGEREIADRLAEVLLRRRGHAVGAVPEVHGVQVQLEDAVLAVVALELQGEARLPQLALHRPRVVVSAAPS